MLFRGGDEDPDREKMWPRHRNYWGKEKFLDYLIFGIIGAAAKVSRLRQTVNWFYAKESLKRMQRLLLRDRSNYKRGYESSHQKDAGAYNQKYQRDDWYWEADTSFRDQSTNFGRAPRGNASYPLSHHYSVLGLDWSRKTPFTEAEIKTAFRSKAMEFHPDRNQDNRVAAEAKFKEVTVSYQAIMEERKYNKT